MYIFVYDLTHKFSNTVTIPYLIYQLLLDYELHVQDYEISINTLQDIEHIYIDICRLMYACVNNVFIFSKLLYMHVSYMQQCTPLIIIN